MARKSHVFDSLNYVGKDGRHLILTVVQETNDSDNTSSITWNLKTDGGNVLYYDTYCFIQINGKTVFWSNGGFDAAGYSGWIGANDHPNDHGIWIDNTGNEQTCAKYGNSITGGKSASEPSPLIVKHNDNGKKNLNVVFLVGIFYYVVVDCGGSYALEPIDRSKPNIIWDGTPMPTYNSCTISAKEKNNVGI